MTAPTTPTELTEAQCKLIVENIRRCQEYAALPPEQKWHPKPAAPEAPKLTRAERWRAGLRNRSGTWTVGRAPEVSDVRRVA